MIDIAETAKTLEMTPVAVPVKGAAGTYSGRADTKDEQDIAEEKAKEIVKHRRDGRGKLIGLVGLPGHGKTGFAEKVQEHFQSQETVREPPKRTNLGDYVAHYVTIDSGQHVLIDLAGEALRRVPGSREAGRLPIEVERFLWRLLPELDGIVLFLTLPLLWDPWNDAGSSDAEAMRETERRVAQQLIEEAVDIHRAYLKFTMVAKDLDRLQRRMPGAELTSDGVPSRDQVNAVFSAARRLDIPVLVAFSKADLFVHQRRHASGLAGPPFSFKQAAGPTETPPLDPRHCDPLALLRAHFPVLFEFLGENVRYFKPDFLQAFRDDADDPRSDTSTSAIPNSVMGVESAMEFLVGHPWRIPTLSMKAVLAIDRWLGADRWSADGLVARMKGGEVTP